MYSEKKHLIQSSINSRDVIDKSKSAVPTVVEQSGRGERAFDIYSRLLRERIIFLGTGINDQVSDSLVAQLLFLEAEDPDKDIQIYINSPGGSVTAGLAIYDTMQQISPDVVTICFGVAASMGAFLLSGGAKGKRLALPNSRIMIHQPLGGAQGQAGALCQGEIQGSAGGNCGGAGECDDGSTRRGQARACSEDRRRKGGGS